ncbi:MAG: hypothetical protein KGQ66_10775 [Acidobacteriota bacterium]|nr:hypothetical protein [Acidobacteriota bacterium]
MWHEPYDLPDESVRPTRDSRRRPRVAVAAGVVAVVGLGGAGLALASSGGSHGAASLASSSSTTPPTSSASNSPAVTPGPGLAGPMGAGRGGVLHGQYTIAHGTSYETIDEQVGSVDTVSSSSITVVSPDGFKATYSVDASTVVDSQAGGISAVLAKDNVRIEALVKGNSSVATEIVDVTKIGSSRQGFGLPGGPGGGWGPGGGGIHRDGDGPGGPGGPGFPA